MAEMDRLAQLKEFLSANPKDSFARYGLAMELAKSGEVEAALAEFNQLIGHNPDYTAAYQMAGQILIKANRDDEARAILQRGLESAIRSGNTHARAEMQAMLDELG